jgi:hypothetical protein
MRIVESGFYVTLKSGNLLLHCLSGVAVFFSLCLAKYQTLSSSVCACISHHSTVFRHY